MHTNIFKWFTLLLVMLAHTVGTIAQPLSVEESMKEISKTDAEFSVLKKKYCVEVGPRICNVFVQHCEKTEFPNTCFVTELWSFLVDSELCGFENVEKCENERKEYGIKLANFMENYAREPGFGWQAVNSCTPFHRIYPKSEMLKKMSTEIESIREEFGKYYSYKEYYECVKSQYLKITSEK